VKEKIDSPICLKYDAYIILKDYGEHCEPMCHSVRDGHIYGIEIGALSKEQACDIVDILCACHTVVCGYYNEDSNEIIRRFDKDSSNPITEIGTQGVVYGDKSLLYACLLVQKVYGNQVYENAVSKYFIAKEIYPLDPMELHPLEDPFVSEYLLSEQIKITNVIVSCYAILEELHLQIKVKEIKEESSVIKDSWNPIVKKDLINRLKEKNIDYNNTIPWLARNGVVRPFKKTVISKETLCEWSDGQEICDFEISICDAILELSHMRSQLASHKLGDKVLKLSVYDAENAFHLARKLLLDYFKVDLSVE
jgi:hypothetical protein